MGQTGINPQTTLISLETFKTITNSNGLFKTWTDIINEAKDTLPVNNQILGTVLKSYQDVMGDNVVFQNEENKNVYVYNDDLLKDNNLLTQDKWTMVLYSDYMLPLLYNGIDRKSAQDWSEILGNAMSNLFVAKQDLTNNTIIEEVNALNIALGQVKIIEGCDGDAPINAEGNWDYSSYKQLAASITKFKLAEMRKRSKFAKGYNKNEVNFLISEQLAVNLLLGKTYNTAAAPAYEDFEKSFQPHEILGQIYNATMYLGTNTFMSEHTPTTGANANQVQNLGDMTGNLVRPFAFGDLHGLMVFMRSIAFYGHSYGSSTQDYPGSRMKKVWTYSWRMNGAVKPVYARFNYSFYSKIPTFPSYTRTNGEVVPARDLSLVADYNSFVNEVYLRQPMLYSAWFDGNSQVKQADLDAMWKKAKINWNSTKPIAAK